MDPLTGEAQAGAGGAAEEVSYLEVLDGPAAGERRSLGARLVIGRSGRCDLVIPGQPVSRTHAEVVLEEEGFVLRDLGSVNGAFVSSCCTVEAEVTAVGSMVCPVCSRRLRVRRVGNHVEAELE